MSQLNDISLIAQVVVFHNTRAFDQLVRKYQSPVRRFFLNLTCGDSELSDDLAQDTFIRAYTSLASFKNLSSFSTWLYRLTSNAAIDFLRRQRRQGADGPSLDDEDTFVEVADPSPSPHQQAETLELRQALVQGLNTLAPEHRQVLLLRELQGLSYEEIAACLELDLGTVKSRIARAREKLRKYLLSSGNFSGYLPSNLAEKEG